MAALLDSPFTPILVAALALALAARLSQRDWIAAAAPAVVFLVAYYQTYQKVPSFPPAGAANKVFYVALIAGAVALLFERWAANRFVRLGLALAAGLFAALWIGSTKFAEPDAWTYPLSIIATVGAALTLARLDALVASATMRASPPRANLRSPSRRRACKRCSARATRILRAPTGSTSKNSRR